MSRRSFLAGGGAPASFQHGQGGRYAAFSCQGLIHRFRRYLEELVRRGYAAFNNADVETLRQLFADTTIVHEPGRSPISGDYQGLDQVLGFFGTLVERSGGTFRATLHDVVANDEHAIGLHSSDAERDGRTIRSPTVLVFHVRDGKLAETWSHHYDQHDFDAFWA